MIYVIGIGPGDKRLMTGEALQAIEDAEVIVGYVTYIKLIKELIKDKEVVKTGMRREIDRCQEAVDIALTGKSSSCFKRRCRNLRYGWSSFRTRRKSNPDLEVKVIPGITASIGAAAVLGAPIMHDFCHISLSDLMTPWEVIEKRLTHAAMADFVVCFYNPRSKGRANHLANAFQKMMEHKSGDTVVGIVKDVGRKEERKIITTMQGIDYELVDMTTVVIVGNKETYVKNGKMITPRGYSL